MIMFGLTGGFIGQIFLAKLSDKIAQDHPIRRIFFIIISLGVGILSFAMIFFIPLPHLTIEQGKDIPYLLNSPIVWIMGILFFTSSTISSLYMVNQAPIIQDINLPEAQGKITSWNQLLENIGLGIGPLLVGILLTLTNNYQTVILIVILFIIPGVTLWGFALKWYPQDRDEIKRILKERANILKARKENSTLF